jgi:hypothetical protein
MTYEVIQKGTQYTNKYFVYGLYNEIYNGLDISMNARMKINIYWTKIPFILVFKKLYANSN